MMEIRQEDNQEMEQVINVIKQTRENFIHLIETSTVEELNEIPAGFNNNIIWNFGHIVASQQSLCYQLANAEPVIDLRYIKTYRKGTKPERFIEAEEINTIKELMRSNIDTLIEDLNSDKFTNYNAFLTHYGVELKSIGDAVPFFSVHDAYHFGFATAIKRVINNKK